MGDSVLSCKNKDLFDMKLPIITKYLLFINKYLVYLRYNLKSHNYGTN